MPGTPKARGEAGCVPQLGEGKRVVVQPERGAVAVAQLGIARAGRRRIGGVDRPDQGDLAVGLKPARTKGDASG